ncbi:MAG: circularly permuted type 2 ATP-grasp protein [Candidatus Gastranaerophilaceae bacterium]
MRCVKILSFDAYNTEGFYDEFIDASGAPREITKLIIDKINDLPDDSLVRKQAAAEKALLSLGITFNVYGHSDGKEKIFPFDIIPRIIDIKEWQILEKGLKQRIFALNLFINDIYNDQKIIKDKIIDEELIKSSSTFRKQCIGFKPPKGIWCHITGTDLVRNDDGKFYILEDNMRCPSGISYVMENRQITKRTFPQLFDYMKVAPVSNYPSKLIDMLQYIVAGKVDNPTIAFLTPGVYNSAYFEHSFLARQMGIELVEGSDLVVKNDFLYMRTTKGLKKIDVLYRRIDDDFIDPDVFRKDSMLGVSGIFDIYKKGNLAFANAPGTGIADDKAIYAYVPKIIKYYLGEDAIIPNVPTYLCSNEKDKEYVLNNMDKLVIKAVDESGGYGMLMGTSSTQQQRDEFKNRIKANPRKYIAQPTLNLSRVPTIINNKFEGRHVDYRPYIIYGEDIYVLPGGLTRVALNKNSLVVNSSQGGGSKDTWVVSL